MRIHSEGGPILIWMVLILLLINGLAYFFLPTWLLVLLAVGSTILLGFTLQFFRHPHRSEPKADPRLVYAPADGKVVVIEEVEEPEYLKEKRLQLSIFMSPLDVHVNRNPVSGKVTYLRHHPGRYLVAWHPKSSTDNERTTTVVDTGEVEILFRQIAGAVARRICNYLRVGDSVSQGAEMGFIKFGSRSDVFLPLDATLRVKIGDQVYSGKTVIAEL